MASRARGIGRCQHIAARRVRLDAIMRGGMARAERDAWLNWPARVAAQMAADLNADGHTLHVLLEKAVRNHLIELGDLAVRLD